MGTDMRNSHLRALARGTAAALFCMFLGPPGAGVVGTRESLIVTGLASDKTYYFVLLAADEVPNWSGFSNVATKQTSSGTVTLATPTGFPASLVSGDVHR